MKIKYQNITQRLDIITRHLTEIRKIILLNFVIVFLASCIILPASSTFAESFQSNERVEFNLNPSISLSISGDLTIENLSPGDGKDSNIITVTATSNAIAGYNVSSTVGNNTHNYTTLNHSSNSNTFTNLSSNISSLTSFNDNTWGYSWCDGTCTASTASSSWISGSKGSSAVGYNGLPLCNQASVASCSGVTLIDESTNGTKTISFKIGAKAALSQASGTYQNVINFVGVANPNPEPPKYMQEATFADCGNTMTDSRDGESYATAVLADGNCWMLDNLRLGVTDLTTDLTSDNTNLSTTITASTWNGYRKTSGFTSFTDPMFNSASANDTTTSYGSGSGKIGVYYNYCAASANTYCYADGSGTGDAQYDVCPAGWRMPTGGSSGEYQALYTAYGSDATNFRNALSTPLSGYFDDSSASSQGSDGLFWSSTRANGRYMYDLRVFSRSVNPVNPSYGRLRSSGVSVRCVLK